mmetsp:Transcript_25934/g.57221  ORF Transcript_25934/g.57221 Transcript_25934/m.57221 type:complete len:334 (+) Transcript_25934:115-1116(+)
MVAGVITRCAGLMALNRCLHLLCELRTLRQGALHMASVVVMAALVAGLNSLHVIALLLKALPGLGAGLMTSIIVLAIHVALLHGPHLVPHGHVEAVEPHVVVMLVMKAPGLLVMYLLRHLWRELNNGKLLLGFLRQELHDRLLLERLLRLRVLPELHHLWARVVAGHVSVVAALVASQALLEDLALLRKHVERSRAVPVAVVVSVSAGAVALQGHLYLLRLLGACGQGALHVAGVIVPALLMTAQDWLEFLALLLQMQPRLWALFVAVVIMATGVVALLHLLHLLAHGLEGVLLLHVLVMVVQEGLRLLDLLHIRTSQPLFHMFANLGRQGHR